MLDHHFFSAGNETVIAAGEISMNAAGGGGSNGFNDYCASHFSPVWQLVHERNKGDLFMRFLFQREGLFLKSA